LWQSEKTQNGILGGKSAGEAKKEVEDKFGKYWPRNILILFGPPGAGTFLAKNLMKGLRVVTGISQSAPFLPSFSQ
jgi:hypothetical protein